METLRSSFIFADVGRSLADRRYLPRVAAGISSNLFNRVRIELQRGKRSTRLKQKLPGHPVHVSTQR